MSSVDRMETALVSFRNGIASGRMAHAHIVIGAPREEGREFVLKALALLYEGAAGVRMSPESHPDVIWIEPQKKSRIISVEQIREVCRRMSQTSYAGGWKSCVITGADCLGDEASNALLKTLEEPSGKAVFFLLTDHPEALLSTVASRCQRICLANAGDGMEAAWRADLVRLLTESSCGETIAGIVPARRLSAILDGIRKTVAEGIEKNAGEDDGKDVVEARISARMRETRAAFLRFVMLWYRDVLLCVCGGSDTLLYNRQHVAEIRSTAGRLTCESAIQKVEAVERMVEQLDRNIDEESVFGIGFCRLSTDS